MKENLIDRERKTADEERAMMETSGRQCRTYTLGFPHLRGERAGYLPTTPVHYGRGLLACPMCGLSELPQSEKPTVSEWQVFPGSSLQCGEVSGYICSMALKLVL